MVFPQQIAAALEIIAAFDKHTYAILLAQMQSGKTGTFMLVLSEMIRLGKVEYGYIFSGNREI
jgi:flagellar motility protein MotE (MotC chaperone)